jgi:hypothetical protein
MRDLIWVIIPVAVVFYFICFPDQFRALLEWCVMLTRHIQ